MHISTYYNHCRSVISYKMSGVVRDLRTQRITTVTNILSSVREGRANAISL